MTCEFPAFTEDLKELVNWLLSAGITTVAMESTGAYWLNLYLMLEEAGIEPYLVNAKHVKNVTGRKKDDTDAIWIQKLHTCGLLQKSFQPESKTRILRTYVRHRKKLITIQSDSVRRMQKSLELMNKKLHTVISDILGKTGLQMVVAIINGERGPNELLKFKDHRIKESLLKQAAKVLGDDITGLELYEKNGTSLDRFPNFFLVGQTIYFDNDTLFIKEFQGEKKALIQVSGNSYRKINENHESVYFFRNTDGEIMLTTDEDTLSVAKICLPFKSDILS